MVQADEQQLANSQQELAKKMESATMDLEKRFLRPLRKEAFSCCAKCCDTSGPSMDDLQRCANSCQQKVVRAEQTTSAGLEELSKRLARCASRCQDTAMDAMGSPPDQSKSAKAQKELYGCVRTCISECEQKLPGTVKQIETSLKSV